MMGSEREALIDESVRDDQSQRYFGPLAMLALLLVVWVAGRLALWESPLPGSAVMPGIAQASSAEAFSAAASPAKVSAGEAEGVPVIQRAVGNPLVSSKSLRARNGGIAPAHDGGGELAGLAQTQPQALEAAPSSKQETSQQGGAPPAVLAQRAPDAGPPVLSGTPPFAPAPRAPATPGKANRWTLDSWAFLREGSGLAPIAQGRVPVYGASQIGAILQYSLAPAIRSDPRLYVRAYRALLDQPESEIAVGLSARPVAKLPVRGAVEVRLIDNQFGTDVRPAAYAVTEIPPIALPLGLSAEIYAGAGYVGGVADTAFVDGQVSLVRKVASFDLEREDDVRISFGAGAWGGAQRDANRLDIGPTMRVETVIGTIPARISLDYRERVAGDAAPVSGVAATLSTQF
ncbi:MAG: hypothetical protein AAFY47_01125 [Pseudomonadota bacterium]